MVDQAKPNAAKVAEKPAEKADKEPSLHEQWKVQRKIDKAIAAEEAKKQ